MNADGMPAQFDAVVHPATFLRGEVRAQPSKNYTTRFLLAAALSTGESRVRGAADSEDARALLACLRTWGAEIEHVREDVIVRGFGASPRPGLTLNPGNAGAVARFLIGVSVLTTGTTFVTDHPDSLGRRPQADLLDALAQLGARVGSVEGRLPITVSGPVQGGPVRGGKVTVRAEQSSQYASALMFLGPLLPDGLHLHLTGEIRSHAPLRQTLHTLASFGVQVNASDDLRHIRIPGNQAYRAQDVTVPGDYPGAAALLTAGAILPGEVRVTNLRPDDLQGERAALDVLRQMGADLRVAGDLVTVRGGGPLTAVSRDGDAFTDAVQVLSAAAALATGTTTWSNVATLRLKECDRITDTRHELTRLGLHVTETADSLSVTGLEQGRIAGGVTVDGHGDHRMIMLLTLLGLSADAPVRVQGAHHIRKSYPGFYRDLAALGASVDLVPSDA